MTDDTYDLRRKRTQRETLFSDHVMGSFHAALQALATRWINATPVPMPTLADALRFAMTQKMRDILDEATDMCPSTVSRTPHCETILETSVFPMAAVFLFKLDQGRYLPEKVPLRPDHDEMDLYVEMRAYAELKARITRNMTEVYHLLQYLNVAVDSLRELKVVWPDFPDFLNGFSFTWGRKNWVPGFQDKYRNLTPGDPPELFYGAIRHINDAQGYIATAQLAFPPEDPPKADKHVELTIARDWGAKDQSIPWHDEILWENVKPGQIEQRMRWLVR